MPVYFQRPENALKRANGQCGPPPSPLPPVRLRPPWRAAGAAPLPRGRAGPCQPLEPLCRPLGAARGLVWRLSRAEERPPGSGAAPPCRGEMAEACRRRPRRMAEARPGRPRGAGPARLRLPLPGGASGRPPAGGGVGQALDEGGSRWRGPVFPGQARARYPRRLSLRPYARGSRGEARAVPADGKGLPLAGGLV